MSVPTCKTCLVKMIIHSAVGTKRRRGCRNCAKYVCPDCHEGMSFACELINLDSEQNGCILCKKVDRIHFMYSVPSGWLDGDPDARVCSECAEEIVVS